MKKIAVVLLSGGIDSCVAAALKAREPDTQVHLLSISYGQGAMDSERDQSNAVADKLSRNYSNVVEHFRMMIDGYSRWDTRILSQGKDNRMIGFVGWRTPDVGWEKAGYPSTRDEAFTLIAAAGLEARLRDDPESIHGEVVLATTKEDSENFEDIGIETYEVYLNEVLARKMMPRRGKQMRIVLPFIGLMKFQVIQKGVEIQAPLELTWSCYFGKPGKPCGNCDQCGWRKEAFQKAGLKDPAYEHADKVLGGEYES